MCNRKKWTLEEDIKLLEESLNNMKKWALISQKFVFLGRTQHSIKNRFICLMVKYSNIKREKIQTLMKGNEIKKIVENLLEEIKFQKMSEKDIFEEESVFSKESEEIKTNIDHSFENAIDILFGNDDSDNTKNGGVLDLFPSPDY